MLKGNVKLQLTVCLCIHTISQKSLQLVFSKSDIKYSMISPGNPFILGSNGQRSRGTKTVLAWVCALLWVLASSSWKYCTGWVV